MTEPQTVGDHLKLRRIERRVFQRDLAKTIGVHIATLKDWEGNVNAPAPTHLPAVLRFLGYVPFEHDGTAGGKICWLRTCAGLSKRDLSALIGCDEGTVARWENNQPGDAERRSHGIAAMRERAKLLGISELTNGVVSELLSGT